MIKYKGEFNKMFDMNAQSITKKGQINNFYSSISAWRIINNYIFAILQCKDKINYRNSNFVIYPLVGAFKLTL